VIFPENIYLKSGMIHFITEHYELHSNYVSLYTPSPTAPDAGSIPAVSNLFKGCYGISTRHLNRTVTTHQQRHI
jgi:hypothetical protein